MVMLPRHSEVWRVDLGMVGKVRSAIVLIADDEWRRGQALSFSVSCWMKECSGLR